MGAMQGPMASAVYCLFALQQRLPLEQLAEAAPGRAFPMSLAQTPEWFAAASAHGSSLLDTAPELLGLPTGADNRVDLSGLDLIRVYAPELQAAADLEDDGLEPPPAAEPVKRAATPGTATQIGLLREISDLDS
jgi:hypothetical protein